MEKFNFENMRIILVTSFSPILGYFTPTKGFVFSLVMMFSFNIWAGMRADGDRTNNHADNLRWVTYLENNNNPITKKRLSENNAKNMQGKEGVLHPNSKPVKMMKNGICLKTYQSIHLAKKDGFNDTLIIRCCKGRMKKHKGYNWEYIQ